MAIFMWFCEINSLIHPSEVTNTADTLISDFYPSELLDNKLFSHPVFGILLCLPEKLTDQDNLEILYQNIVLVLVLER